LFLVPKHLVDKDGSIGARNDVVAASLEHKLGIHASPTCVMKFGEKGGAVGYLVGEENRGLNVMFIMMNAARLAVGVRGVAVGDARTGQTLPCARARRGGRRGRPGGQAGPPIRDPPSFQRRFRPWRPRAPAGRPIPLPPARGPPLPRRAKEGGARAAPAD